MTATLTAAGIRWAERRDYAEIVEILCECFPNENWTIDDLYCFSGTKGNVIKGVFDMDNAVYAVLLYTISPELCRIRRIAVVPEQRRQGYAGQLLQSIYNLVQREQIVARVRESNKAAALLFRQLGYLFDPKKPRERDKTTREDYYEFKRYKTVRKLETAD